ncbi:MAG: hypothetical protein GY757_48740 [bacterium]|nr:hypothetical protein [bacterium]
MTNKNKNLMERFDSMLNPVLVKDIRSWLRSKKFMAVFFLALGITQLVTFQYIIMATTATDTGRPLYTMLLSGLALILAGILPYLMQERFSEELSSRSIELSLITAITPGQLVRGKILSGLAASLLFFSAVAPSLTIAYMLGGIAPGLVLYSMALLLFFTVAAMVLSILLVSMVGKKKRTRILSMIFLPSGFGSMSLLIALLTSGNSRYLFRDNEFWLFNILAGLITVSLLFFFYFLATARLSFQADNRDTKPRLALSVTVFTVFFLFVATPFIISWLKSSGSFSNTVLPAICVSSVIFLFGIMFLLNTPARVSQRILSKWPRSIIWSTIYYPGPGRLYAFILFHILFFCIAACFAEIGNRNESFFFTISKPDTAIYESLLIASALFALLGGSILCHHLLNKKRAKKLPCGKTVVAIMFLWTLLGVFILSITNAQLLPESAAIINPVTALIFSFHSYNLFKGRFFLTMFALSLINIPVLYFMLKTIVKEIKRVKRVT